ncbi:MAG TPA: hypothetical protein VLW50_07165 [Streptosporangiaceae bacterium]|nr:hypothetical protein [Streptosporangiaceae bacterium]
MAGLAIAAALALAGCGARHSIPDPVLTHTTVSAAATRSVEITFYGWPDNDPANSDVLQNGGHAGGTGTYTDPITLATDSRELAAGTRVYVPYLRKYFVMDDACAECITDWTSHHRAHFDLWIGGKGMKAPAVLAQESKLTPAGPVSVIVNPPPNKQVDTKALLQYQSLSDGQGMAVDGAERALFAADICRPCSIGFHVTAATARARSGDLAGGRRHLDQAQRIAGMWQGGPWRAAVWQARGALRIAEGDCPEGLALFREAA